MPQPQGPVKRRASAAAMLLVFVGLLPVFGQSGPPEPHLRRPSPAFTVQTLRGELQLASLLGKVVLLDFMTTTCPACQQASHAIQGLYAELGPRGFQPVGVALDAGAPRDLVPYSLAHGITFDLATAPRSAILEYLQFPADRPLRVPTLVLLDRQGRVCAVEIGWPGDAALRATVLKLLNEPPDVPRPPQTGVAP